jgi:MFS family permease
LAVQQSSRALIIVVASFTVVFTACGITFVFGVYQDLYESMSLEPDTPFTGASPATIDLIGTIAISLMSLGAPFATAWTKRFTPRRVIIAGAVVFSLANLLASYSQKLWQFELTQGLLLGIGTCLTYIPAVTVAPTWFDKRRGLAMGLVISGTGVGGVVFAPAMRALNSSIGFRNTLRLSAGVSFVLLTLSGWAIDWDRTSGSIMQQVLDAENITHARRISTGTHRHTGWRHRVHGLWHIPLVDWRIVRSRKFAAQALGAALQAAAYYTPVFFFSSYARTLGYSASTGANFIALSNAMNAVGKIVIGYAADRCGRVNTLFATTFISAVVCLGLWLPSTTTTRSDGDGDGDRHGGRGLFIAFVLFYGIFASAYVSLFPTSLVEIFGVANYASVNGVLYMLRGVAALVGTPVAGALIRGRDDSARAASSSRSSMRSPISYEHTSVMVGVLMALATVAVLWVRLEAAAGTIGAVSKWRL